LALKRKRWRFKNGQRDYKCCLRPQALVDWHEIESGSHPDCGEAIPTQVSETREMTEAEYNAFIARPLAKREWLAGKGGYQGNIKQAIALVCPGRETLYVDPSGSDYGRYVGRAVV
jgi:hypothetical protein